MKTHSPEFLRKRKSLLLLPLPVALTMTIIFWSLGGGSGTAAPAVIRVPGLNTNLPAAQLGERETWDKFKLYEIASYDSAKYEEARESDPYFDLISFKTEHNDSTPSGPGKLVSEFKRKDRLTTDKNEERVNQKIDELVRQINRPTPTPSSSTAMPDSVSHPTELSADVDRLEAMMENIQSERQSNPEMQQISEVLEKILDIQYPERMQQKLPPLVKTSASSEVKLANVSQQTTQKPFGDSTLSLSTPSNGFFGLEDGLSEQSSAENIIEAVVHSEQELVTGATIKLRLLNDIVIDGHPVARDSFIHGTCSITGERLVIDIASIRSEDFLLKVSLKAYDLDGIEGIYVPGAITRDVAKQSSDNALQSVQLMSMNPSLGAQAAAAGVEAAKGLFSKKAKLIKVTVKAGYQVMLKNASSPASF